MPTVESRPPPARLAGALYLVIIVAAMCAELFVRGRLIVSGDLAATAHNIVSFPLLYRSGTFLDLLVLFCDTGVAVLLYLLLEPVHRGLALLASCFRLVFVAVMAVDAVFYFAPLTLLQGGGSLRSVGPEMLRALAETCLQLQGIGYDIALVFFGVHCVMIGVLIGKSVLLPRAIGGLMMLAGACYLVNSFNNFLPKAFSAPLFPYVLLPGLIGEAALTFWLLYRGVSAEKWRRQIELKEGRSVLF